MITIRKMEASDIPQLARLYRQFWDEDSDLEMMRLQFEKVTKRGTHLILSAVEGDNLVGSVMGVICDELYGDCKPFMVLENMIVDKEQRNKGIGKR